MNSVSDALVKTGSILVNGQTRMSERALFREIHQAMELIRNLLKDELCYQKKIDKAYEDTLMSDLKFIPEQFDKNILEIITVAKVVLQNINFAKMNHELQDIKQEYYFEPNVYQTFETCIGRIQMGKLDRVRIMNIIRKFKPLFECIDYLISTPIRLIFKIGLLQEQHHNDDLYDVFD